MKIAMLIVLGVTLALDVLGVMMHPYPQLHALNAVAIFGAMALISRSK